MTKEILFRVQKNFPLLARPFQEIANELGLNEDEVIDWGQVDFYLNDNGLSKVINYELIQNNDIAKAQQQDIENQISKDKIGSRLARLKIMTEIITLIDGKEFDAIGASIACQILNERHELLAVNGLGNYKAVSKYPVKTLGSFIAKLGYELVKAERVQKGENRDQFYAINGCSKTHAFYAKRKLKKEKVKKN